MGEKEIVELCNQANTLPTRLGTTASSMLRLVIVSQGYNPSHSAQRLSWSKAPKKNPVAFAARMLGTNEDNAIFQVSTSPSPNTLVMDEGTDFFEFLSSENVIEDYGNYVEAEQYEWTGNMSEIFASNEVLLALIEIVENAPDTGIDLSDLEQLDSALIEAGTSAEIFQEGDEALPKAFNFWDSF